MTPIHPGRIPKRELQARDRLPTDWRLPSAVPSGRINDILNGKRGISAETALQARSFLRCQCSVLDEFAGTPTIWRWPSAIWPGHCGGNPENVSSLVSVDGEKQRSRSQEYLKFHINVFYSSEENGGYIADIPDLDACSAFWGYARRRAAGSGTRQKPPGSRQRKKLANSIPLPRYRPVIYLVGR